MAVDMFIKIDEVDGESIDAKHPKDIDVLAWSWGACAKRHDPHRPGGGAGKVSVQDLSFTKYVDSSSHALLLACCKGTHYDKAVLMVRKAGDNPLEYIKVTMEDLIVSSISTGAAAAKTG